MNLSDYPTYENPITTKENIDELHHLLVQTCINYMMEHKLTDIDEVHFLADGLSYSYEYGEWTPGTDSSLTVLGLQIAENDKYKLPERRVIGESY